jgi:hypothetical protein
MLKVLIILSILSNFEAKICYNYSMPPDLQQNVAITTELTVLHNFWALSYFTGLILSILWSLWKPSRAASFALLGFGLLLFSFEYTKHILEPFRNQTMNSIITQQQHLQAQRIINGSIVKLIPFGSITSGWVSLLISAILLFKNRDSISKG